MNTSLTGHNEGLRLFLYDDHNGKAIEPGTVLIGTATLGYGLAVSKPYGGIEQDEADFLLIYRLWKLRRALAGFFTNWTELSETRRAVLTDVAYNRGLAHFDEMLKAGLKGSIERGDFVLAAHAIGNCPAAKQDAKRYAYLTNLMANDAPESVVFRMFVTQRISDDILTCITQLESEGTS